MRLAPPDHKKEISLGSGSGSGGRGQEGFRASAGVCAEISQQHLPPVGDGHEPEEPVTGHPCPLGPPLASLPRGMASFDHELAPSAPFQPLAVATGVLSWLSVWF